MRLKDRLEEQYRHYNHRDFVHPDPLEFLFRYDDLKDREVAGLIASALAYGRVERILVSVERVLGPMGESPRRFLMEACEADMGSACRGFVHRFCKGDDMAAYLCAMRGVLEKYGSIEAAFSSGAKPGDVNALPGLSALFRAFVEAGFPEKNHLMPDPSAGSPVKRLNLFLRWMVRKDAVDPGGWETVKPSQLIVPLDTHLHRVARELELTSRNAADMKTALEITGSLAQFCPEDPVRYDFALTRPGIRGRRD